MKKIASAPIEEKSSTVKIETATSIDIDNGGIRTSTTSENGKNEKKTGSTGSTAKIGGTGNNNKK